VNITNAQLPLTSLSGIGKQTVLRLQKLGIHNSQDLLFHLPLRYEDRTRVYPIGSLSPGMSVLITGTVDYTDMLLQGRRSLICRISDSTGFINLRFFHFSASQQTQLKAGVTVCCFGEIRHGYAGLEIIHPEYKINQPTEALTENSLTPVYPLTEGLRQGTLRKTITQALSLSTQHLTDYLPTSILKIHQFPSLQQALQLLHAPPPSYSNSDITQNKARKRLAFEELLAHHLLMRQGKLRQQQYQSPVFQADQVIKDRFLAMLPFQLTTAQQRVIAEIEQDCCKQHPMLRLVQGDVGSGKTIVAACSALLALNASYQVAIMAPTELLAEQHLRNFSHWFAGFDCEPVFLTGQLKGKARQQILEAIADGSARLIIGTHALFQDSVNFHNPGLIIIDEQHRFGVHQRLALREKSRHTGLRPHQLVMTATPIPRTLAMLQYSDLDISIIDELPPGRKPVATSVIPSERRDEVIARIGHWVAQHRQAYWVCTLIEESETLQCEAAEKTAVCLREALPNLRIALVHGRMKAADKDATMQAFKRHEFDLLVATTVIEVGVDVPNAGLMIIENPERLGLSQLHQLRGRVGRGEIESYCLLLYQSPLSATGKHRLGILRESNDGFVIAEKDLELRGPGEVMGTRQTGQMQFRIANLSEDQELLDLVQEAAELLCRDHPEIIQPIIDRWLTHSIQFAEV
jgi:ATP-dependent DNA helicase RecG